MAAPKPKKSVPVNLLPQNEFEKTLTGRILKWILTTFRIIVISVELVVIIGFLTRFWLDIEHSDLNDEITQKQAFIESYLPFEQDYKLTQKKLSIFSSLISEETRTSPPFSQIVRHLPSDIRLVSFTKNPDQIQLNGLSFSEQSISQFIANLKSEPNLKNISLSSLESIKDSPAINFRLIITTKPT